MWLTSVPLESLKGLCMSDSGECQSKLNLVYQSVKELFKVA